MRKALSEAEIKAFRERLCAAAETLYARQGVTGVTMRQIARELGYSQTAAYRYFADKDEILAAVRASVFNRFTERLEAAAEGRDARSAARAVGSAYLAFAVEEPDAYRLMFDVRQPDVTRYPQLAAAIRRAYASMTGYIEALVESGALEGDADELGKIFWSAAHGLVMTYLAGLVPTQDELDRLHQMMMRMLMRGAGAAD